MADRELDRGAAGVQVQPVDAQQRVPGRAAERLSNGLYAVWTAMDRDWGDEKVLAALAVVSWVTERKRRRAGTQPA